MGGRPTKWTPTKLKELGEELLEFVQRPDVWHLSKFCIHKKAGETFLHDIATSHPSFSQYIEQARLILGNKYVDRAMAGKSVSNWAVQTVVPMYLKDIKQHKLDCYRAEKEIDAEFSKKAGEAIAEEIAAAVKESIIEADAKPKAKR